MRLHIEKWYKALSSRAERLQPKSRRSRSILLYLFFVLISSLLWCFMTFNNPISMDMKIPLVINNKPDNVTFITEIPDSITATVQDRGMSFIQYFFRDVPTLEIDFNTFSRSDNTLKIDGASLRKKVARLFGRKANVTSVLPEQIAFKFTANSAKIVPVEIDLEGIKTKDGYVIFGSPTYTIEPETVKIYGDRATLDNINKVYAERVVVSDLSDTLRRRVRITNLKDARVEPAFVKLTVPIERLVDCDAEFEIEVCNTPPDETLNLFPSRVKVTYTAPQSIADRRNTGITVVVDYNDLDRTKKKIPIRFGNEPPAYGNKKIDTDSVEYLIEKKTAQ